MALISGKIAYLGNYKNHDDTTRAITAYHDAILADRNQSYIEDMIKKQEGVIIKTTCTDWLPTCLSPKLYIQRKAMRSVQF